MVGRPGVRAPSGIGGGTIAGIIVGVVTAVANVLVIGCGLLHRYLKRHHKGKYPKVEKFSKLGYKICLVILRCLEILNCCKKNSNLEASEEFIDYEMGRARLISEDQYQTTKVE